MNRTINQIINSIIDQCNHFHCNNRIKCIIDHIIDHIIDRISDRIIDCNIDRLMSISIVSNRIV